MFIRAMDYFSGLPGLYDGNLSQNLDIATGVSHTKWHNRENRTISSLRLGAGGQED